GAEASEGSDVNRPLFYRELDNLGQVLAVEQYDGDGFTTELVAGVPVIPAAFADQRRARLATDFDDQGRVYRRRTFNVSQSDGTFDPSRSLATDLWYDHRGQLVKAVVPGGVVSKTQYDSVGRSTLTYLSDGGGDTSWADALTVTADQVLSQAEFTYDANSNLT